MTNPELVPEGVGRTALGQSGLTGAPARCGGRFGWDADVTIVSGHAAAWGRPAPGSTTESLHLVRATRVAGRGTPP